MKTLATLTLAWVVLLCASASASAEAQQRPRANAQEAHCETAAKQVLDAFMAAFSAKDPAAHVATYHFPHFRLARGSMSQWPTEEAARLAHVALFQTLPETGWHRSEWVHRNIVTCSASKIHVDTRFKRLRKDGSIIGIYDSLYVLSKHNDRWGIKLRSSFL